MNPIATKIDNLLLCDVDSVVLDLTTVWLARYNAEYGDTLRVEDIKGWGIADYVKKECGVKIYDYLHKEPSLYNDVQPVAGSQEGVKYLKSLGWRVVFATAGNYPSDKVQTLARFDFVELIHGKICRNYVACHDKSLLRGKVLIDDHLDNLARFDGAGLLLTTPSNEDLPLDRHSHVVRVNNWYELCNIMPTPEDFDKWATRQFGVEDKRPLVGPEGKL